jgi:hypothetical protein
MRQYMTAIRKVRLSTFAAVLLFCCIALPVLAQAPPSQDTFVSS